MLSRTSRRGYDENVVENQHLNLNDLKKEAQHLRNQYLVKENIPSYPHPEFHVSHVKHDTNKVGLEGIMKDRGFKNPFKEGSLMWWSLVVGPDEIRTAEKRLLETTYPDRTEEQAEGQQSFLEEFATSPAFNKTSRLGSYRFTFHLEELLTAYSQQFCQGAPPVMRVLETVLYKQEVMYVVVVHSPDNQKFSNRLKLTDVVPNAVCSYRDGCFIWRPEAMCETHRYELVQRRAEKRMEAKSVPKPQQQFYVWDNVAVALHVENQVLKFDPIRLRGNLKFCPDDKDVTIKGVTFEDFPKAEENVKGLWPGILEKDE